MMPELMALLTVTCLAAEHRQWGTDLRARTLAIVFDGMRPQHPQPPGATSAAASVQPAAG